MIARLSRTLWKRRWWLLAPALSITVGNAALVMKATPTYQATAKILVVPKDRALSAINEDVAGMSELSSVSRTGGPLETQMELLKSTPVVDGVIRTLQLQHPKKGRLLNEAEFLGQAKVSILKGTDILQLTYTDRDPERAQHVVNGWMDWFVNSNRDGLRGSAASVAALLEKKSATTRAELAKAETALMDYKKAHGAIDLQEDAKSQIQAVATIRSEQRDVMSALGEARSQAQALRERIGLDGQQALAATAISQAQTLQRLRQELLDAETDPQANPAKLGPDHPQVQEQQAHIQTLRAKMAEEVTRVLGKRMKGASPDTELDPVRQALTQQLIKAEVDVMGYETRLSSLRKLGREADLRVTAMPATALHVTQLERQVSILSEQLRLQLKRLDEARIAEVSKAENMRVVQRAELPDGPAGPSKKLRLALGLLAGMVAGLAVGFLRDALDGTLQTPDQTEPAFGIITLGAIPWMPGKTESATVAHTHPDSRTAEGYRNTRINLRAMARAPLTTIAVCSPGPNEGRTAVAVNLAISLAQSGVKVLLVDANLRGPAVTDRLGLAPAFGLADVVEGRASLDAAVIQGPEPGMHVLASSPAPLPSKLLESPGMDAALAAMRDRYDMVLFDTPPMLAVTDARLLAPRLDGALLVGRLGHTPRHTLQRAARMLEVGGTPLHGMVLTNLHPADDHPRTAYHRTATGGA